MDTLSSSVSTLKVPTPYPTSRELCFFKSTPQTPQYSHLSPQTHLSSTTKTTNKTITLTHKTFTPSFLSHSQPSSFTPNSPTLYREPASGYAAALVDIAQCNNSLNTLGKDVQRFLKILRNEQVQAFLDDQFMSEKDKGQVIGEVAKKGRFDRHLASLIKMLIQKNKVGIVKEVLEEFERIHDELSGTQVVLVSSATKMEEDQLFGIARRVQKLSGATKVKVRNLVHDSLPSFAV
ncbi:ATP synthase delta chain, chloroplastic-like [Quercus lobata]|uniref:ATP synthase delta chain n=1 Tax=Quercus lobata TaxID=97700 RepID=A0A7N2MEV8_QUELO|nr:ATP synthase delta chain, chloroplastic-like [Quercus lobata]